MAATIPPPLSPAPTEEIAPPPVPPARNQSKFLRLLLRLWRGLKSWLLAALSCLSVPFAIVFSGWTYRLVQRRALCLWAKRLGQQAPSDRILPRWILSETFKENLALTRSNSPLDWIQGASRAFFGSLGANFKSGFLTVFNSMLVTLPGGMIMMFSWYSGWDNSFNKGYEQAAVGPLWGFAGIFLFMAAMTYVPIAQARQAAAGSAKAFWNYRKVRDVINDRPIACLLLIAGYTALGAIFMIAVSALMFIGNGDQFAEMTVPQIISYLNSYYFWWAVLFIVPGFIALKLLAGRIYAGAAFDAITGGRWKKEELTGREAEAFEHATVTATPPALPGLMRTSLFAFSMIGRFGLRSMTFLLLFAFAIELYVAQFFTFEPAANWLRQPMVQIPWYHSIPGHLEE